MLYCPDSRINIRAHFLQFMLFTFGIDYLPTWLQWMMHYRLWTSYCEFVGYIRVFTFLFVAGGGKCYLSLAVLLAYMFVLFCTILLCWKINVCMYVCMWLDGICRCVKSRRIRADEAWRSSTWTSMARQRLSTQQNLRLEDHARSRSLTPSAQLTVIGDQRRRNTQIWTKVTLAVLS